MPLGLERREWWLIGQSGIRKGNKSNNYPFLKSWRVKVDRGFLVMLLWVVQERVQAFHERRGVIFQFPVDMESSSWLEGCFIGRLRESAKLQSIKESFILGGFSLVRVRLLGEKYVLLSCDEGDILGKVLEDNKAWFDSLFSELSPWRDSFVVPERFAWVRCRGIPLQLWCN